MRIIANRRSTLITSFVATLLIALATGRSSAAPFDVTRTDDPAPGTCDVGDCSLREAVIAANAAAGADTITLPAGTYTLTIASVASDTDASIGDLDIAAGGLTINGAGAATTTISAAGLGHRVFHLPVDILIPDATVTISNLTITGGNTASFGALNRGGAIEASSRFLTLNLSNVVLSGNTSGSGAGVYSQCTLNITNSTISGNTGSGITHAADGSNFRTATITGSTISGHTGTGVDINAGTCNITNSTLSGNGTAGGFAGGIDYGGGSTAGTLTNVTIASNRYGYIGQNDFIGDPIVTVRNTIIANSTVRNIFNNPADADFARPPTSGGNNLISDTSGTSFTQPTDKKNVDPLLGSLAVNAPGTTATHALAVNSPALDSASAAFAPATDQRGVARPQGSADDMGAYELAPPDDDMDGFSPPADCNDNDDQIHPGAAEIADDGIDQDCSGADTVTCFVDGDTDGFGSTGTTLAADGDCTDVGESTNDTDCDDTDPSIHPGAAETPDDAIDQDCSGSDSVTCFIDADTDGFGSTGTTLAADGDCTDTGESTNDTDCDDTNPSIHPGAAEIADDGIDQDCSGADTVTCFVDGDTDGFGSTGTTLAADGDCTDVGESTNDTDCDDADSTVHPGATETCNGEDDDCDMQVDEGADFYQDADTDGFGDPGVTTQACAAPPGYVADNSDCDDTDPSIHPGAAETPDDAIDQDCSGSDSVTCFIDADTDGFGSTGTTLAADGDCTDPGESANDTDCNDAVAAVHPGATETCNGEDDDCDMQVDEGAESTFYQDADTDGFGDPNVTTQSCAAPPGYVADNTDCDDADPSIHPGAAEIPDDAIDQNCSGSDSVTCFVDADSDDFGSAATIVTADGDCTDSGESTNDDDCNDGNAAINPAAADICDGVNNNCSGGTDEGFPDLDTDGTADCVDADRDGDGTPNNSDGCPDDPDKTAPGTAGCGAPEPPASPTDQDGVSDAAENGAPNNGDGNNDGVPDGQQVNVSSLPNADGNYVTIVAPAGTQLASVSAGSNPSPSDAPADVQFPAGFLSYVINGLSPGAAAQVQIIVHLPPDAQIDTYWKFGPEPGQPTPHWYEFLFDGTTGAEINGHTLTLHFVDGQRGDADLTANGSIQDPGAPALAPADGPPTAPSDLCSVPVLSFFLSALCGLGCPMAILGSFSGLVILKTARRRRR